ncbi:MAG: hypothetical protein EOO12_05445 [Chitinophagaceae bacterium]|nr:MAG: hypothetical protein EOO12_05445 [Chitinophagaceae bacterium]
MVPGSLKYLLPNFSLNDGLLYFRPRCRQGANDEASRQLLRALLHDTDKAFLLWAMRAILTWKNKAVPPGIIRIHGSADRIIPCKRVRADHVVNGAGHLMVFTHAEQVSEILERIFR